MVPLRRVKKGGHPWKKIRKWIGRLSEDVL